MRLVLHSTNFFALSAERFEPKANPPEKMASTTKSKKSTKSKPTVLPPPSKSAERVTGSDLESDSEENEEKQVQYGRFTS